jgi:hypothetical protein
LKLSTVEKIRREKKMRSKIVMKLNNDYNEKEEMKKKS